MVATEDQLENQDSLEESAVYPIYILYIQIFKFQRREKNNLK